MHSNKQEMREGFTTGSAATAAAMAAAHLLLHGGTDTGISIPLPPVPVEDGRLASSGCLRLTIPVSFCRALDASTCLAGVQKDGGDDPDATHGALIEALVSLTAPDMAENRCGITMPDEIFLYGGEGVGTVTLPGLPVAQGEAAINPEPRRQIAAGLSECKTRFGYSGPLHCVIRVPEGVARARRTLNGRLGILGGISILGTRGTVKPYSHDAWRCSISQAMDVARALGCETICLSTGRRSERALQELFPELPAPAFVQVADYAGFSLEKAAERNFSRVVWGCFPGKLLKLAQGLEWTHARSAAPDFILLGQLFAEVGAPKNVVTEAADLPTALGALELLSRHSTAMEQQVLEKMTDLAAAHIRSILDKTEAVRPTLSLRVFSMEGVLRVTWDE